ncbi:hypothetical protein [Parabacteroides sp. FAFU027]|uniref:hypothetical protein n=1 Tax=Parabacteroides sp. FAFU027 TaxID=2922715 RepID=UPI001FAF8B4C|nr:hypothetical protein [Parabacteroides sp. FAFU027]
MKKFQNDSELKEIICSHFSEIVTNVEIEKLRLTTCHEEVVKIELKMVYGENPVEITLVLNGDKEPMPVKYLGNMTYTALSKFLIELGTLIHRL